MSDLPATPELAENLMLQKQIATLVTAGMPLTEVCKTLKISRKRLNALCKDPGYRQFVDAQLDSEIGPLLVRAKTRMSRLVDKAVDAVERALTSGQTADELKAAGIILKAAGLEQQEEKQADTSITVILPTPQPKEVVAEVIDDEIQN